MTSPIRAPRIGVIRLNAGLGCLAAPPSLERERSRGGGVWDLTPLRVITFAARIIFQAQHICAECNHQ